MEIRKGESQALKNIEEKYSSIIENVTHKIDQVQNTQDIWNTGKRPNLWKIGKEKGEEIHIKGTENISNKTIEKNCHNLKKDGPFKVHEVYRTSDRLGQKKNSPLHIIIKTPKVQNKARYLNVAKEKDQAM